MNAKLFSEFMQQSRICILGIMDNLNVSVTYEFIRLIMQKCNLQYWCYELFGVHCSKCDGGDMTAILTREDFGFDYYARSERKLILSELDDMAACIFAGTSSLSINLDCLGEMHEKCMLILLKASDPRQKNEIALNSYTPIREHVKKNYKNYAGTIKGKTEAICDIVLDATVKTSKQLAEEIFEIFEEMLAEAECDEENDYDIGEIDKKCIDNDINGTEKDGYEGKFGGENCNNGR